VQHLTNEQRGNKLLIVAEVAAICRVSERTVRHWINTGKLRSFRVGRRHLLRYDDIAALLAPS
jgi:excisionase family DNA binding protein